MKATQSPINSSQPATATQDKTHSSQDRWQCRLKRAILERSGMCGFLKLDGDCGIGVESIALPTQDFGNRRSGTTRDDRKTV